MFTGAGFHVGLAVGVGQGLDAKPGKVAVAQPAVVLVAGVDDQLERLCGHFFDRFMQLGPHLVAGAAVDEHRTSRGHDQADVGIEPFVLVAATFDVAHKGVHTIGHWFEADLDRSGGQRQQAGGQCCRQGAGKF